MSRAVAIKLFSVVFLIVFFSKMAITIAPLIVAQFNSESVNAAIMQLEIEHNTKPTDVKEISVKEYLTITSYSLAIQGPEILLETTAGNDDHAKHIQAFYPSVPTPPPNV